MIGIGNNNLRTNGGVSRYTGGKWLCGDSGYVLGSDYW